MLNKIKIEEISKVSKAERWPFPKTLDTLKKLNVESYDVEMPKGEIIYYGKDDSFKEQEPTAFKNLPSAGKFDLEALKKALIRHQVEKTSYVEMIREMVQAGIARYHVNMEKRTCTFFGYKEGETFVEQIPEFVEST